MKLSQDDAHQHSDTATCRRGFFYGWWIAIAGSLGMSISSGINYHGFGNFVIPLSREFGWNRTIISAVVSLARLQSGLLGPLEGWAVDRLGPRRLALVGIPLMGLGYILFSKINSLLAFFVVFTLLISLGSSLGFGTPMSAAVANWFKRKRGLAFGWCHLSPPRRSAGWSTNSDGGTPLCRSGSRSSSSECLWPR